MVKGAEGTREVTILDISDYHAQLTPLAEAADTSSARPSTRFGIGGSAFLKPWFDIYEAESALSGGQRHRGRRRRLVRRRDAADLELLRRQADDPIMKMMGIDVDGLGNHNFDHGQTLPADRADPARDVPDALGERRRPGRHDAAGVVDRRRCSTSGTASRSASSASPTSDARTSSSRGTSTRSRSGSSSRRSTPRRRRSPRRPTRSSPSGTTGHGGTVDRPDRAR